MTTTTTVFEQLPLAHLVPHPRNVRTAVGNVSDLATSIKAQGVLQPLVVAPHEILDQRWTIIAGHRRHAAAKKAGLKTVPCVIRHDLTGGADQLQAMLTENLQRSDLNAVEEGDAYQALLDLSIDVKAISARTGRTQKTIRERVKIAAAPEDVRTKVIDRQITIDEALTLQQFAAYPNVYETLAKYPGTANWSWAVQNAKNARSRADAGTKLVAALRTEGVRVMDNDEREAFRLEQTKARGVNLLWAKLPAEPKDRTSESVCASFHDSGYGAIDGCVSWHVLVTEDEADEEVDAAPTTERPSVEEARAAQKAKTEAAAEQARREQLAADLTTAATVRRDHLRDVLVEGSADTAHELLIGMVSDQLDETEVDVLELVVDMLSLPAVLDNTDDRGDILADRVRGAAQSMSAAKLVILLRYLEQLPAELALDNLSRWLPDCPPYSLQSANAWRCELGGPLGYEWSDVEAGLLDDLARAEAAADDE
ncbi:ParB/RepB/Spo0J family partition protein [Rhodococcus sp. SGAir0479]|uniref:ParB/RepB/Spo0J family partition protein n=1 Tax=Rhodococcus sp. SGAir0479 TaxID=2567884 RepID=UPI0010CD0B85|nr:ParB/RepB/Spo0J family partition protein [Rhodococcus sp. SGAir0479]QCQ91754.1 ParB/RepB/Spo0J family partition protein [Rhodococcus sp. SGAir0479]